MSFLSNTGHSQGIPTNNQRFSWKDKAGNILFFGIVKFNFTSKPQLKQFNYWVLSERPKPESSYSFHCLKKTHQWNTVYWTTSFIHMKTTSNHQNRPFLLVFNLWTVFEVWFELWLRCRRSSSLCPSEYLYHIGSNSLKAFLRYHVNRNRVLSEWN